MFELNNPVQRHKDEYNNKQYFVTALKKIIVLILVFSISEYDSYDKTNKKQQCKNDLTS
jgi:hypothetical protein